MPGRIALNVLLALALTGCGERSHPVPTSSASATPPAVCRVGPDGGPVSGLMADKGIGGTGAPRFADRGIGGTGAPVLADRGIGGTGIIAVISGFASICLAGQEVALPANTPITLGSDPGSVAQLRAGQVAVVTAETAGTGLSAQRVMIRYEVSGPVDASTGDRLLVAGQDVRVTDGTLGMRPAVGDWVAVSGIRRADGAIEATRLELRAPGPATVHGALRRDAGQFHVGQLPVAPSPGLDAMVGRNVTASGSILLGRLQAERVAPDLLASDPAAFFGPAVGVVLVEGVGEFGGDRLRLGQGFAVPARGFATGSRHGVFRLERGANGLRAVGGSGGRAGIGFAPESRGPGGFAPAPMPDRSLTRGGAGGPAAGRLEGGFRGDRENGPGDGARSGGSPGPGGDVGRGGPGPRGR